MRRDQPLCDIFDGTRGLSARASIEFLAVAGQRGLDRGSFVDLDALDQLARIVGDRADGLRLRAVGVDTARHLDDVLVVQEGSVPRLGTSSGMMAPWFLTMARMVMRRCDRSRKAPPNQA